MMSELARLAGLNILINWIERVTWPGHACVRK